MIMSPKCENGKMRMCEEDMLIPALKVIKATPNCKMRDIKKKIGEEMIFFPADLKPSPTRNGECMYHQIIGNLTSHIKNNVFGKYVTYSRPKGKREYQYELNDEGKKYLNSIEGKKIIEAVIEYEENLQVQEAVHYEDSEKLNSQNNRKPQLGTGSKCNRHVTNPSLAKTVLKNSDYKCEYGILCGEEHKTFKTNARVDYIEAHHLIPMMAQNDFGEKNLDRVENIIGLCPLCHRVAHYGNSEDKIKMLKKLYQNRIDKLRHCEHKIDITFEELINKYYK